MQSLLCGREAVHKIPRAAEIPNLDLYMTDLSDSTQEAERLPHPSMSLFMRPELRKYPKLAAGRVVVKEKAAPANPPAAARSPRTDLPDDIAQLKKSMAQAKNDKLENGCVVLSRLWEGSELTCTPVVPRSSILPYRASSEGQRPARPSYFHQPRGVPLQPQSAGLVPPALPSAGRVLRPWEPRYQPMSWPRRGQRSSDHRSCTS